MGGFEIQIWYGGGADIVETIKGETQAEVEQKMEEWMKAHKGQSGYHWADLIQHIKTYNLDELL